VKFGRSKTKLGSVAEGKSQTYTADDFCSLEGKFIDPGYIHDVLLTTLEPSTEYYYSCGVTGVRECRLPYLTSNYLPKYLSYVKQTLIYVPPILFQHMSSIRSFKTAPQIGADVGFKFIVYGDHGTLPAAYSTAKYVLNDVKNGYEFIFHNGDISYARGMVSPA
jgi:hypothetical protein